MTLLNGRSTTESLDRQITTEPASEGAVSAESLNDREKAQLSPEQSGKAMEDSPPSQVQRPRSSLERWFTNLPVGRKQFLALLICELVPLVGLGLGAGWIVTQSSRQQLTTLAKAEAEVTNIAYNLKVNQMGLGSRGQADNLALVNAALDYQQGIGLASAAGDRIRKILKNEVRARRIEYATLVSSDLTIIANANRDRQGQLFDPHSLISIALDQKRQVKASELVSWSELQQEGAVLPDGLSEQDVLIRYVITPVFDPIDDTQVIGALLFGDIVNGKSDIPKKVLQAFDQGYSAVYQRDDNGNFSVASSLQVTGNEGIDGGSYNLSFDAEAFLEKAAANPQETFTQRMMVGGQPYTLAVQSQPSRVYRDPQRGDIPVYDNAPHALLIHGTPETELGQLMRKGLIEGAIVTLVCLALLLLWNRLFRRTLLKPLLSLESATEAFAQGDRQQRAEIYGVDEVGQLAMAFNGMADSIIESEQSLAAEAQRQTEQAQRARQLSNITVAMRETADEASIFQAAVDGVRQILGADRVVVYRFNEQYEGTITAESVLPGWASVCGQDVADPCFAERYVEPYRQGRVHVVSNIEAANLQDCYRQELEPFEVKANLVVPILVDEQLLGLLCIHQCAGPRDWQDDDVSLAQQVATQLGYALEQAQLIRAQEQARRDAEVASAAERKRNEALQMQLIELLSDVENVADGDLTIRANVSEGAIGTVADFFNSIVESLRQVVTQVKDSATQVNQSVDDSSGEIRQLAHEALRQSEEINTALNSVETMTRSIQAVATSARETASVSQTAAETAVAGGVSMDRTVENILTLRETIGETAKKVKRLGESSQQISKVVYLINQIAMQTNLLAINAGIEAARAGEQGQGFAVVAEEVGELAARSASATKEIEQIVETIQRETGEVVQAMELGTTQVVEGTHLVEDAKQNLNQIVSVSRQIEQLVQSISDATVSQADTSQSITELMQKLSAIAQRTSSASTEVSDSLQNTLGVTEQLQQSVGTFKVT